MGRARVIKREPDGGDPVRRPGAAARRRRERALFRFLNISKQSVDNRRQPRGARPKADAVLDRRSGADRTRHRWACWWRRGGDGAALPYEEIDVAGRKRPARHHRRSGAARPLMLGGPSGRRSPPGLAAFQPGWSRRLRRLRRDGAGETVDVAALEVVRWGQLEDLRRAALYWGAARTRRG